MQKALLGMVLMIASSLPASSSNSDTPGPVWKAESIVVGHNIACSMSFSEHRRGIAKFSRRVTIVAGNSLQLMFSDMERGTQNLSNSTLVLTLDDQEYSTTMLEHSNSDLFATGIISRREYVANFLYYFGRARRGIIKSNNGNWLLSMQNSAGAAKSFQECVVRYAVMPIE